MIFFFGGIMIAVMCGLAIIVFVCALPLLLKPLTGANNYGALSSTTSVGQAIVSGFRRALDFNGRANPMDFWFFAVFVVLMCGLSVVATLGLVYINRDNPLWISALPLLVVLGLGLPSLALAVRRLHDINKSGGWLLLLFAFGYFILLYWFFQPSQNDLAEKATVFE